MVVGLVGFELGVIFVYVRGNYMACCLFRGVVKIGYLRRGFSEIVKWIDIISRRKGNIRKNENNECGCLDIYLNEVLIVL